MENSGKSVVNEVLQKVLDGDIESVKQLYKLHNLSPDICDEHGMSPLCQAAYKGNYALCRLFIDMGADVNFNSHQHSYTALHFAALSGNSDVCRLLLSAGARYDITNKVNRTAAQMAAFVGNHHCVATINNFLPRSIVDYYTAPRGLETSAKLPPNLAAPLHHLLLQVNLHPISLIRIIESTPAFLEKSKEVLNVVELISEKQVKTTDEFNEVLAFKFHYFKFVIEECRKEKDKSGSLNNLKKKLLRGRPIDGVEEYMENFVRESVKSFPYLHLTLFQQLVTSLHTNKIGEGTSAVSILHSCINGQKGFADLDFCAACGEEKVPNKCTACKMVYYCNKDCQKMHWFTHKKFCKDLAAKYKEIERKNEEQRKKKESAEENDKEEKIENTDVQQNTCSQVEEKILNTDVMQSNSVVEEDTKENNIEE